MVVSALAHYTEYLAVENAGGIVREIPDLYDLVAQPEKIRRMVDLGFKVQQARCEAERCFKVCGIQRER